MILKPECLLCHLKTALEIAKQETQEVALLKTVLLKTMMVLEELPEEVDSFLIGLKVHEIVEAVSGNADPCREIRETNNKQAENLIPIVTDWVDKHPDPLWAASKAAVMGNLMDMIAGTPPDSAQLIDNYLKRPYAVDDLKAFQSILEKAKKVVYLGDNAGEVFFDRLFIQRLNLPTLFFIKGFPFANDAQYADAILAGIHEVATIKEVPLSKPLTVNMNTVDGMYADFLHAAQEADLVVIKGQSNYELFRPKLKEAFYLFVHKCPVIARMDGADIGDMVFFRRTNESLKKQMGRGELDG